MLGQARTQSLTLLHPIVADIPYCFLPRVSFLILLSTCSGVMPATQECMAHLPVLALAAARSCLKVCRAENRTPLGMATDAQLLLDITQQQGAADLLADHSHLSGSFWVAPNNEAWHAFQPRSACQLLQCRATWWLMGDDIHARPTGVPCCSL